VTNPDRPDARPWQERQRSLREDAVLDAAAELLADRGFAATSMDEIAARVGVSKPTLYQHFPSKDAVAVAVLLRRFAWAAADLARAEAAVAAGAPARGELERVLHEVLARRAGLWATRVEVPPALAASPALAAARDAVWARLGALVDGAKREGSCRRDVPTPVIVRMFAGLCRGDYLDLVGDDAQASPESVATALVSLVVDGLAPRAGAAARGRAPSTCPCAGGGARRRRRRSAAAGARAGRARAPARPAGPLSTRCRRRRWRAGGARRRGAVPRRPRRRRRRRRVAALPSSTCSTPRSRQPHGGAPRRRRGGAGAGGPCSRGRYFPVSASTRLHRTQTVTSAPAGAARQARLFNERTQFSPRWGLTFLLLDFGGRSGRLGVARESANAADATYGATVVNTVLEAERAYFGYQSAREVAEAQTANVRTAGLSRDAAVARYRAGLATVADTLQAATLLAQARVTLLGAEADRTTARAALATVMNARADARFVVAADSAPTAAAAQQATAALTANVDTLVARAQRLRPDVDAARDAALPPPSR
jgi:AcrR family transcriptional regulator